MIGYAADTVQHGLRVALGRPRGEHTRLGGSGPPRISAPLAEAPTGGGGRRAGGRAQGVSWTGRICLSTAEGVIFSRGSQPGRAQ